MRGLPQNVTWTTRLRSNAALYDLAPLRTGKRGRPRLKGAKLASLASLASLAKLAGNAKFTPTTVTRYGTTTTVSVAVIRCLWYGVFGPQAVQVVLVRDRAADCRASAPGRSCGTSARQPASSAYTRTYCATDTSAPVSPQVFRSASSRRVPATLMSARRFAMHARSRRSARQLATRCSSASARRAPASSHGTESSPPAERQGSDSAAI